MFRPNRSSPATSLCRAWNVLSRLPAGTFLFSRLLGLMVPYTRSIRASVEELSSGHSVILMPDRRHVRNHLKSIHAIALANLAELSTGLAILYGMPDSARAILVEFEIKYVRKARGPIRAQCHCEVPHNDERREYQVDTTLTDQDKNVVATARATWLIGPSG